ncbi:DUF4439 domain-containing protein [Saccharomonospora piscinae]|uniref:DUF4439 domain-containing protein n=1 Tax=Saccharomonospora piscinae TaxID=687388 RepID=UPI0005680FAC
MHGVTSRSPRPALTRRTLLRAAGLAALAVPASAGLTACASGYEDAPDPLRPLWLRAAADAKAADALGGSGPGAASAVESARRIAAVRSAHADALRAEVRRLNRPVDENAKPGPSQSVDDIGQLWTRLAEAAEQARRLAAEAPRHRAGLLGSVSAGCAAALQLDDSRRGDVDTGVDQVTVTTLDDDTAAALQTALAAEHAACWVYDLSRAFLSADYDNGLTGGWRAHAQRRDACERVLAGAGHTPVAAEAAYVPAEPVTGAESAARVVATAESDTAAGWHGVLERTDDATVRTLAVQCLTGAATRGVHWRREAGIEPVVPNLPGRESVAS